MRRVAYRALQSLGVIVKPVNTIRIYIVYFATRDAAQLSFAGNWNC